VALGTQRPFFIASTSKLGFGLVVRNYVSVCYGGAVGSPWQYCNFDASFGNKQHSQVRYVGSVLHMIRFPLYCHLICEGDTHLWQLCMFTVSTEVMFSLECLMNRYGNVALFMQSGTKILR